MMRVQQLTRLTLFAIVGILTTRCQHIEIQAEAPVINKLPKNSPFLIILPEDHRTGYNWQLLQDYNTSVIQRINEVWHGNEKGIYFNLRTLAVGQTTLEFVKRKYTDTADYKAFIIKIEEK